MRTSAPGLAVSLWLYAAIMAAAGAPADPSVGDRAQSQDLPLALSPLPERFQQWNQPFKPFRIIGNIYYVGASGISSFLLTTPEGHILLDTGFEQTLPMIRDHVRELGFRFEDIKVVINSHAHVDHSGGHARLKELTGARIVMSQADAILLSTGGRGDFSTPPENEKSMSYRPAKADQIVKDLEEVTLGGTRLTAHLTPGHTKGCTTWTTEVREKDHDYSIVFFGSTTILEGVRLTNNPKYPNLASEYERTYQVLRSLPCDVFLAPHGSFFSLESKARKLLEGAEPNPFVDPKEYGTFIEQAEQAFRKQLEREEAHL